MAANPTLTLTRPDDWHVHLRSEAIMSFVSVHSCRQFGRVLVMPNLRPPVTTTAMAMDYRQAIVQAVENQPGAAYFDPKMTLYMTDNTSPEEVDRVADNPDVLGFKLYPAGATTNSSHGVTRLSNIMPTLERMADKGVVLQVHGEVTDINVDTFDREAAFIEQCLYPLCKELPELRVVFEHITTKQGVDFVASQTTNVAATITPQHLMYNRNALFQGGLRPHLYCLPVLKREEHRGALVNAATSGDPRFFLGTDSAPHLRHRKEMDCGCAGVYSAHAAIELYAQVFDSCNKLDKLEGFSSHHGADFYGVARNDSTITLERKPWQVAERYLIEGEDIIPLGAGEELVWQIQSENH